MLTIKLRIHLTYKGIGYDIEVEGFHLLETADVILDSVRKAQKLIDGMLAKELEELEKE